MVAAEVLKWGFKLHGSTARLLDVTPVRGMVSHDAMIISEIRIRNPDLGENSEMLTDMPHDTPNVCRGVALRVNSVPSAQGRVFRI